MKIFILGLNELDDNLKKILQLNGKSVYENSNFTNFSDILENCNKYDCIPIMYPLFLDVGSKIDVFGKYLETIKKLDKTYKNSYFIFLEESTFDFLKKIIIQRPQKYLQIIKSLGRTKSVYYFDNSLYRRNSIAHIYSLLKLKNKHIMIHSGDINSIVSKLNIFFGVNLIIDEHIKNNHLVTEIPNNNILANETFPIKSSILNNVNYDYIYKLLESNKPISILRTGTNELSGIMAKIYGKYYDHRINFIYFIMNKGAGLYTTNEDFKSKKEIINYYGTITYESISNSDICMWSPLQLQFHIDLMSLLPNVRWIHGSINTINLILILNKLKTNTRILVISPFTESIKKNIPELDEICKNPVLKNRNVIFLKAYNTIVGNNCHTDWKETYNIMCDEISELKDHFDIALLSCGCYGMPLCNYIKNIGKKAIYCGGILPLIFGITGKRNLNHPYVTDKFTRPLESERPKNYELVEGGCYW